MTLRFGSPLLFFSLLLALPGCSMRQLAVEQTAVILRDSLPAFEKEWDYELVAEALPANIKMVEGFLQSDPGNPDLLLTAAQAYTSYALVVLEDRYERAEELSPEADALLLRTREMYLRGHRYGLRLLDRRQPGLLEAFAKPLEQLEARLVACDKEDAAALFWAGMPLASAINMGRDDVTMIALIPKAKALVSRALALDERYYHSGSHMVLGALYGSAGKTLGGDYQKSAAHFKRALELTERRFLLVQVMYAKTLAVQLQDQALYEKLLGEVLAAKLEIFPEQKLANVAAKRRARRMLAKIDELF